MKSPSESVYGKKRNGSPYMKAKRRPKPEVSQFVPDLEGNVPFLFLGKIHHPYEIFQS